jgi:hypothetical protein
MLSAEIGARSAVMMERLYGITYFDESERQPSASMQDQVNPPFGCGVRHHNPSDWSRRCPGTGV